MTDVCVSVVCVCDNDNLTLNSSLRGAGLMLKHTQLQPLSPCLWCEAGVAACVNVTEIVRTGTREC